MVNSLCAGMLSAMTTACRSSETEAEKKKLEAESDYLGLSSAYLRIFSSSCCTEYQFRKKSYPPVSLKSSKMFKFVMTQQPVSSWRIWGVVCSASGSVCAGGFLLEDAGVASGGVSCSPPFRCRTLTDHLCISFTCI